MSLKDDYESLKKLISKTLNNKEYRFFITSANDSFIKKIKSILKRAIESNDLKMINQFKKHPKLMPYYQYLINNHYLLKTAAQNGTFNLVKMFIEDGKVSSPNRAYISSALHESIRYEHEEIYKFLLDNGADVNHLDQYKESALFIALQNGNIDAVQLLLDKKADISLQTISGSTLLHQAVILERNRILKIVLNIASCESLLDKKDIYGQTPLDIAIQMKNDEAILLLAPKANLKQIKKDKNYGKPTIAIAQKIIIKKMEHFMDHLKRDKTFLSKDGLCNGFAYLYIHYASRGYEDYYFHTLELMSNWNEHEKTLYEAFDNNLPQTQYYKNLAELFEGWINDVFWFQHNPEAFSQVTGFKQSKRVKQVSSIYENPELIPNILYSYPHLHLHGTKTQLREILGIIANMPTGIKFEISDNKHITSGYLKSRNCFRHYDPNSYLKSTDIYSIDELMHRIMDRLFIINKTYDPKKNTIPFYISIIAFKKDIKMLNRACFSRKELPNNSKEAVLFQNNSPNRFTHLHIAVINYSLQSVKELLSPKHHFINLSAKDVMGQTPLDIAINSGFDEAASLFVSHHSIKYIQSNDLMRIVKQKMNKTIQVIKEHNKIQHWFPILRLAIKNGMAGLVKFIVNETNINKRFLPEALTLAINQNQIDIIKLLLKNNVSLCVRSDSFKAKSITPLAALAKRIDVLPKIIQEYVNDINMLDDTGTGLIHYLIKSGKYNALELFLKHCNPNPFLKNKDGKSPLKILIDQINHSYEKNNPYKKDQYEALLKLFVTQLTLNFKLKETKSLLSELLFFSIQINNIELFKTVISKCDKTIINQYDSDGYAPIHRAVNKKNYQMLCLLIDLNADINLTTKTVEKNTCMHEMIKNNFDRKFIELFLNHDASINIEDAEGKTAKELLKNTSNDTKEPFSMRDTSYGTSIKHL